jgi:hypothetical protein
MKVDKQQWLTLINEQQQSGLSIAAFCRDKNIKVKYFYYHRTQHLKSINPSAFIQAKPSGVKIAENKTTTLALQYGDCQLRLTADVPTKWLASLMKSLA